MQAIQLCSYSIQGTSIQRKSQNCQKLQKQWADYDIEILIGEILNKQGKHEAALQHFNNAANMCPAKFIPLMRMQRMYKKIGDTIMARSIAKKIIEKPVKINSDKIDKIKELMANELK